MLGSESPIEPLALIRAFAVRLNGLLDNVPEYQTKRTFRAQMLAKQFDVSPQTSRKWLKGDALPNPVQLIELAQYLNVSLDYLLGGIDARTDTLQTIPVYSLDFANSPADIGMFVQDGSMYREVPPAGAELSPRAWVRNWTATIDPAFSHSDTILIDLKDARVADDALFLVRTNSSTAWRHVFVPLAGDAVFRLIASSGREEEITIKLRQIELNESGDINARPSGKDKVLLVGRVIAIMRNVGFSPFPVI